MEWAVSRGFDKRHHRSRRHNDLSALVRKAEGQVLSGEDRDPGRPAAVRALFGGEE